jgi:hypothetical protein
LFGASRTAKLNPAGIGGSSVGREKWNQFSVVLSLIAIEDVTEPARLPERGSARKLSAARLFGGSQSKILKKQLLFRLCTY